MKDIYLPNLLRVENYGLNTQFDSSIPYFLNFNLNNNAEFRALVAYQISNILEKVVLFDCVYIDLLELPLIINELIHLDLASAKVIFNKGLISYIDMRDLRLSTMISPFQQTKNRVEIKDKYTIGAYGHDVGLPSSLNEFEEYIHTFINDSNLYNEIKPSLNYIYEKRKKLSKQIDVKDMVESLNVLLKSGSFSKIGIGCNNYYFITDKNKNIFNLICRFYRDNYVTKMADVYTYYFDDTIESLSIILNNEKFIYDEEFFKLSDINKLPDLRSMILSNDLDIHDVSRIIKNKNISKFRDWFFNSVDNGSDIEKEFVSLLKIHENVPIKIIRYIIPNLSGFIPIVGGFVGIALDTLDTFLVDKLMENSVSSFMDSYSNIVIDKKGVDKDNKADFVAIPIKEKIEIDNSLDGVDLTINNIATILTKMEDNIDYSNDDEILRIFLIAGKISGNYWRFNIIMERYLHLCLCLTKKLSKYAFVILKNMEDLYSVVDIIESFSFARDYYFESYYSLVDDLNSKGLHIENNPFKVENDSSVSKLYNNFLKNKEPK